MPPLHEQQTNPTSRFPEKGNSSLLQADTIGIEHEIPEYNLDMELNPVPHEKTHDKAVSGHGIGIDPRDKSRKIRFRKVMSGDDLQKYNRPEYREHRYGDFVHLMGRREQAASQIAHALGWSDFPKVKVRKEVKHPTDHLKNKSFIESSFIDGHLMLDYPPLADFLKRSAGQTSWKPAVEKIFPRLDQDSIHRSSLFNWLVNNRDSHINNFMITKDHKLVPIDYGLTMDKHENELVEEGEPNAEDPIIRSYWNMDKTRTVPRKLLQEIHNNRDRILNIIEKQILPHYPEHQRAPLIQGFRDRLDRVVKALRSKEEIPAASFYSEGRSTVPTPIQTNNIRKKNKSVEQTRPDATNQAPPSV